MSEENNNFESSIREIFTKELEVPQHVKNTIRSALKEQAENKKKNKAKFDIIKVLVTTGVGCVFFTGIAFSNNIPNTIKNFFSNNKGMDNAIEQGYIDNVNMEYINSNGTEIKINSVLMDEYNLSLEFSIKLNKDIGVENIRETSFPDMIITDENNNILYCEDKETFEKYCEENGLNYKWKENNNHYINSGSNEFIKSNDGSSINLVYNLYSSQYPKSKKILIKLNKILYSENGNEKSIIEGNWQIEYDVPEKFYNREEVTYVVKSCTSDKIQVEYVTVSETTTKMQIITDEKATLPYELTDDEETKNRKIQEELERQQNMTIEEFENSRKFKDEYIENDKGEKYYPSNSTSEDTGYSFINMEYLVHWQTFNLNKYTATDNLKNSYELQWRRGFNRIGKEKIKLLGYG